jgi:alpha-ketoglutarate-dependent sulfate ester dioxygenase
VGTEREDGDALVDDILARATAPHRVYRHAWRVGDLVIWDNRGVLHRALPYDPHSPREMHRTTLHGNEAIQC